MAVSDPTAQALCQTLVPWVTEEEGKLMNTRFTVTDAGPPACALCDCPHPRISGASSTSCLSHTPQTQGPFQSINTQCHSVTLEGTALCLTTKKHLSNYKQTPIKTHGEEQLESKYAPTGWDHFISHYIWFFLFLIPSLFIITNLVRNLGGLC